MIVGCSGRCDLELVSAGGVLDYRNRPLENVTVTFIPEKGPLAHGVTDSDGNFVLATGTRQGIVAGPAKVIVSASRVSKSHTSDVSVGLPLPANEHEGYLKRCGEFQVGNHIWSGSSTILWM